MRNISIPYGLIIRFGLLAGSAIVLFESVNLFVLYRQIRLDLYLSIVAAASLIAGVWIRKERKTTPASRRYNRFPHHRPLRENPKAISHLHDL
ncbi:hypothetical protein [Filimonas effusa]|uniref:Uncharacterized protein n=1 Tax=Filimonas effusa TaxID=2508721 RepID=A0A4Q1D3B1_9BACT|nr:hypothetical protein [Filimonas effusa]RXK82778.1 hypothetical protein ESB13_11595 [Filimonas effusa]